MTYQEAKIEAYNVTEATLDNYLKAIENSDNITDYQYYNLRHKEENKMDWNTFFIIVGVSTAAYFVCKFLFWLDK